MRFANAGEHEVSGRRANVRQVPRLRLDGEGAALFLSKAGSYMPEPKEAAMRFLGVVTS